eukprot:CAMPEP_0205851738 /NCGR_PEP_ID=MMETSP1083-20121108/654_1 /ASSEMBLY_ACC=CAM_ASM_000430 /TAXON_ID=97485 /ORGANISM="Prymnesium parvum, Strain Texoma1" /LENGTH=156 /DNA_ID=CAMNT_0053212911 /DNA_START=1707 /DNA_END=2174 /DNA_ORIENTATION=-
MLAIRGYGVRNSSPVRGVCVPRLDLPPSAAAWISSEAEVASSEAESISTGFGTGRSHMYSAFPASDKATESDSMWSTESDSVWSDTSDATSDASVAASDASVHQAGYLCVQGAPAAGRGSLEMPTTLGLRTSCIAPLCCREFPERHDLEGLVYRTT